MAIRNDHSENSRAPSRAEELFQQQYSAICRTTDRLFVGLMLLQFAGGIFAALFVSPNTWIGATSEVHLHVWAAVFLGGAISSLPVYLGLKYPGRPITRHVIATAQVIYSALLIHLTGGRIETHFHVFVSLAFLSFYRDWRLLVFPTIVVAADHAIRGIFWPLSVYGVFVESPFRWFEHAAWVIFEVIVLANSCYRSKTEMRESAERQEQLEITNQRLVETARQAGKAEIATSVLHNVGNVLNSVNVSAELVQDKVRGSTVSSFTKATDIMEQHLGDMGTYVTQDERGKHLPRFLIDVSRQLAGEEDLILDEINSLISNIDHIKAIVTTQQSHARGVSGVVEEVSLAELLEDAIHINTASMKRHSVATIREFDDVGPVLGDKQKILQILVNLISNAKYACMESENTNHELTVRLQRTGEDRVSIEVSDNGMGIAAENLTRIFAHGFTTREEGHGFGLHSAALAAKELGGRLTAYSNGLGTGATFTLEIPYQQVGVLQCTK